MMKFISKITAGLLVAMLSLSFFGNALADTLTVYSTPGSTVSGRAGRVGVDETLATIRAGAGNSNIYDVGASGLTNQIQASTTSPKYQGIFRGLFLFDTSALPDDAIISSAVVSLWGTTKTVGLGAFEIDIVSSNPASNTVLANASYGLLGATPYSSVASGSLNTGAYNDFSLDASGIATISPTGISKFGSKINWDTDNNFTGVWASSANSTMTFADGGVAGTDNDPKLVITYTLPVIGPANMKTLNALAEASVKLSNGLAIASVKSRNGLL